MTDEPESASKSRAGRFAIPRIGGGSDLAARVAAAVPLALLAIFLVAVGGWTFTIGLVILGVIALRELFTMFERYLPPVLAGLVGLVLLLLAAKTGGPPRVLLALVICLPVAFIGSIVGPRRATISGLAVVMLGLVWIGIAFAHAVMLRDLPHGSGIVFLVLIATFLTDTGAYFGGRALGSRKMAPAISPAKTVEGLLIGILVGTLAGWFVGLYFDWLSGIDALAIGFCVALFAPVGDLFESYVKREAGAKDSGAIFGAHGGVLDRLDAVAFSIIAGYYVWNALL
ncbi:MAG: hypothetical protein F2813_04720 [Actinobacteria bacterium]|uniref:Unannotated protein n=1 Tax=freshwater metagenome TaxID=449393 RepID=A0A6J5ZYU9_9ZZZZ|nr:hypothetical protein [Actinomycetota bacterium]